MIHKTRRRSGARGLAVTTAMTLCGVAPLLGTGGPAHADGPVVPGGRAGGEKATARARWRPAKTNLALSTSAPAGPILPGRTYSWPYAVTNKGAPAQSVRFTATLPANVGFVSAQQNCSAQGGQVVCELGTMQAGQTRTGAVTAKVLNQTAPGQPITMTGVVTATVVRQVKVGSGGVKRGPLTVQQAFPQVTTVMLADVSVAKSAPAQVRPGGTVAYKITIRNQGPSLAQNVTLTDTIQGRAPIAVTKGDTACTLTSGTAGSGSGASNTGTAGSGTAGSRTAASRTGGSGTGGSGTAGSRAAGSGKARPYSAGGTGFVCDLGSLAAGQARRLTLRVKVGPKAKAGAVLKAPARVTTTTADLNTANNMADARTKVVASGAATTSSGAAPSKASTERASAPYLGMTELPRTGEQSGRLVTVSLGLVAFGALLIGVGGRRREKDHPEA